MTIVIVLFYSLVLFFSLVFLLFHAFINFRFNARHCILQRIVKTETNLIYTQKRTCLIYCQNFSMEVWSVTSVCEVGWALLLPQARQCTTSFQFTQQSTSTASYLVLVSRGQKVSFKSPVLPSQFRWHCGPAVWRQSLPACLPSLRGQTATSDSWYEARRVEGFLWALLTLSCKSSAAGAFLKTLPLPPSRLWWLILRYSPEARVSSLGFPTVPQP